LAKSSDIKVGQTYGAWLVVEKRGKKYYCVCTLCGESTKYIPAYNLSSGRSRMCKGCSTRIKRETHGMSDTGEYNTWVHMNQRCHNPNNKDYAGYGGRGIEVFPLWRKSFESFYMMIGPRPEPDSTIERIDYNKGYVPGNVKWASRQEQVLNKSDNVVLEIDGVSKTVSQWAAESPVSGFTIYKRIKRGWLETHGPHATVFRPSERTTNKDDQGEGDSEKGN
jgi:hypothetical protein